MATVATTAKKVVDSLPSCDLCAENHEATRQCLDCGVRMCFEISRLHCMLKENRDHRVRTIEEARAHLLAHPLPVVLMCPDHPDKAFEYFDETCQKLLCVSCAILGNHSGHKCKSIPEAARAGRNQFQQAIGNLNSKIQQLATQGTSTQGIIQDFASIIDSRRTEVDSVFDKLIDDLETRRASLHQQIDAMVEKKSSLLNNQLQSGERLKHSMEELRDRCTDWKEIANDSQCLVKLLESKKELAKVNQLFTSNRESFSNLIPSVRPVIEVSLPSTDQWEISTFGGVCDQKLSESSSILQRSAPDSTPVLNGEVMKVKLLLRDTNGSQYADTSSVKPITVTWEVVNLEKNTYAALDLTYDRTVNGELEYSYTVPFFDHRIQCLVNGKKLESPLEIQLTSISENLQCMACGYNVPAVQAHLCDQNTIESYGYDYGEQEDIVVKLPGTEKSFFGLCASHLTDVGTYYGYQLDETPQKCNVGLSRR